MRQHTFFLSSAFPFFGNNGVLSLPWDRVCWFIICMLSHSQLSLQACLWVYWAWNRVVYRAHRQPSHLLPALCFACNASIANEVKGSSRCAKSYRDCRSLSVEGTISFRQMRWRFAQWTISLRHLPMTLCRGDNFISVNAMTVCARDNIVSAFADVTLSEGQSHFGKCDGRLRKVIYLHRSRDSRFAQKTVLMSQVEDVFCSDFKPWYPIAKVSLTPGRWWFPICELIFDGKTIAQIMMWEYSCFCVTGKP